MSSSAVVEKMPKIAEYGPKLPPKCLKMAHKGPQWYNVVIVWHIAPDLFVVIQAVLNSKGEKLAPNWPSLLLWQLKSLRNQPNMAQYGQKRLQKAPPSTVWLYPGLM